MVTRRAQLTLSQKRARQHIVSGFLRAVDHLDAVVALIRAAADGKAAKAQLIERFEFSDEQAEAILNLSLRRLTGLAIGELRKEDGELTTAIGRLEGLLKDQARLSPSCPLQDGVLRDTGHARTSFGCEWAWPACSLPVRVSCASAQRHRCSRGLWHDKPPYYSVLSVPAHARYSVPRCT